MGQPTKQDIQCMLDTLRGRILDKVATRQDVQSLTEASRDRTMTYVHDLVQVHQQNMMRRTDVQNSQLTKRLAVLEARLMSLEQELKTSRQLIERTAPASVSVAKSLFGARPASVPPEQMYGKYMLQAE